MFFFLFEKLNRAEYFSIRLFLNKDVRFYCILNMCHRSMILQITRSVCKVLDLKSAHAPMFYEQYAEMCHSTHYLEVRKVQL